jgi:hypothetical protein
MCQSKKGKFWLEALIVEPETEISGPQENAVSHGYSSNLYMIE